MSGTTFLHPVGSCSKQHSATSTRLAVKKVNFHKDDRAPLLITGNDQDHTIPASVSKEAAMRLGKSKALVDYVEFAGRPHFTASAPGWERIADFALDWAIRHVDQSPSTSAGVDDPNNQR
jgi:hypothetical protein